MAQLALFNVARGREALEHPVMDDFRNALDRVNAKAEASPGFVWRWIESEAVGGDGDGDGLNRGKADYARDETDPNLLLNLSVWESVETALAYVYAGMHGGFLKARERWFVEMEGPHVVAWWIPRGHVPTISEAFARLDMLAKRGATAEAFTLREAFPSPLG
jgi:hypothetical protein